MISQKDRIIKNQIKIKKNHVSEDIHKLLQGILLFELLNDVITSLLIVVPNTDKELAFEGLKVFVLAEQSLLPKNVNLMVNVVNHFFERSVV